MKNFPNHALHRFFGWPVVYLDISRKKKISNLKNRGEQAVFARPHPFLPRLPYFA